MFHVYYVAQIIVVATIVGCAVATTATHRRIRGAGRAGIEKEGTNKTMAVSLHFFVFFAISR